MVNNNFVLISGFLNLAGGIFLLVYWYAYAIFLPYGKLSDTLAILVENRNWTWINGLGALGALCGLLGQAGIYFLQVDQVTWISSIPASPVAPSTARMRVPSAPVSRS